MTNLRQLESWLGPCEVVGNPMQTFDRVHTDTRTIEAGDLFVALQGEKFDGSEFLDEAKGRGAVAAIASSAKLLETAGLSGLVVSDAKTSLGRIAKAWRAQFNLSLIAVTGSNGKTTVTQMVNSILQDFKGVDGLATNGNFNNAIGVPLTLLRLRANHKVAVVEMGMNHPGEIELLALIAKPTIALVNNAQREHLEFMESVEAVARENGTVISVLGSQGVAVLPVHDAFFEFWRELSAHSGHLSFGLNIDGIRGDIFCEKPLWSDGAWQVAVQTPLGQIQVGLHVAGIHNVTNALAAIACCFAAGIPLNSIRQGLERFRAVKGRSCVHNIQLKNHAVTLVDDSYNANPDSVRAAIDLLVELPGPHLLILGDMGEVGDQGIALHFEVGLYAKTKGIEALFSIGGLCESGCKAFNTGTHFADIDSLNLAVSSSLIQFASVLVKGSRFMRMERVVQYVLAQQQQQNLEASCC